ADAARPSEPRAPDRGRVRVDAGDDRVGGGSGGAAGDCCCRRCVRGGGLRDRRRAAGAPRAAAARCLSDITSRSPDRRHAPSRSCLNALPSRWSNSSQDGCWTTRSGSASRWWGGSLGSMPRASGTTGPVIGSISAPARWSSSTSGRGCVPSVDPNGTGSGLFAGAPPGGAAAYLRGDHGDAVAGAEPAGSAVRDDREGVHASGADRGPDGGEHGAVEAVQVVAGQVADRAPGADLGQPQRLVRQQVADAGDGVLVEESRL